MEQQSDLSSFFENAQHCLAKLKSAIDEGDTLTVRDCSEKLRKASNRYDLAELITVAEKLEESVSECSLTESLNCLWAAQKRLKSLHDRHVTNAE